MRYIPNIIHFIWFGRNPYPPIVKQCMKSWEEYCPTYKIKLWNEDNFNIESNVFVKEAYEAKKWAFVSDYVRLYALYNEGGVYIDSDVEILKPIDELLYNKHVVTGYATKFWIQTGFLASEKENIWIKLLMDYYDNRHFKLQNGKYDMRVNNDVITRLCEEKCGFVIGDMQIDYGNVSLYPSICFHPPVKKVVNWTKVDMAKVKENYQIDSEKTICIHYVTGSWVKNRNNLTYKIKHLVRKILPQKVLEKIEKFYYKHRNWTSTN